MNTNVRQNFRDLALLLGTAGIVVSVFLMLASLITTVKLSKLAILALLFVSSVLFYKGLAPQLKLRLNRSVKLQLNDYWRRLQNWRNDILRPVSC
ncbi:hypothetical protein [Agaribacter flavus]|uniref:Uncharacterized protein n=1 Tax=Agaribacter flavus TaxID=1902781 RepID=A0ABV7FMR1_9ALTE